MFNEPKIPEEEINASAEAGETAAEEPVKDENAAETEKKLTPEEKLEAVESGVEEKAEEIEAQIENDPNLSREAKQTKLEMLKTAKKQTIEYAKTLWEEQPSVCLAALTFVSAILFLQGWMEMQRTGHFEGVLGSLRGFGLMAGTIWTPSFGGILVTKALVDGVFDLNKVIKRQKAKE